MDLFNKLVTTNLHVLDIQFFAGKPFSLTLRFHWFISFFFMFLEFFKLLSLMILYTRDDKDILSFFKCIQYPGGCEIEPPFEINSVSIKPGPFVRLFDSFQRSYFSKYFNRVYGIWNSVGAYSRPLRIESQMLNRSIYEKSPKMLIEMNKKNLNGKANGSVSSALIALTIYKSLYDNMVEFLASYGGNWYIYQ